MTNTLQVEISPATVAQTAALTTMVRTSSAYTGGYRVMVANQTIDADYIGRHLTRVALGPDGELLGFVTLQVPGRGGLGEGEVDFMFVADDAQGRGIGRLLLDDLRERALTLGLRRLHVVSHPPSAGFYRSCSFRDAGVVEPYGRVTWSRPHLIMELAFVEACSDPMTAA